MLYDDSCQLGAGLSASRRAWERVSLHELGKTLNKQNLTIMKKTLIALFALTGVASAALTEIADMEELIVGMTTVGTVGTVDGYNQTVYTLDGAYVGGTNEDVLNALNGTSGVITFAGWINLAGDATQYNTLVGWGASGTGFKFGVKDDDLFYVTKNVKETVKDFSIAKGEWTMIALQYNVTNKNFRLTATTTDGQYYTVSDNTTMNAVTVNEFAIGSANGNATSGSENFDGMLSGFKVFTSTGYENNSTIAAALGAAPVLIPEPTTATLSLLALAGLAARRRRASR